MKLLGKLLAAVIAGIVAVIAVQGTIRRMYQNFGKQYIELPPEHDDAAES